MIDDLLMTCRKISQKTDSAKTSTAKITAAHLKTPAASSRSSTDSCGKH